MKNLFTFALLLIFGICFSQIITGNIENEAGNPVSNVNIYVDGSKISTVSASDGSFSIDIQNLKNGNLVFQKETFESYSIAINKALGKKVKVVLNKFKDIEEVVLIPYTEEAYRNYIQYFLNEFIGSDQNNVKIKNQRTLKFSYDKKNKLLKVKAPKTLTISNKNLGYEIQYNLIAFEADFNNNTISYAGTSFFKEISQKNTVKINRMDAYSGSMMHFLRSVYSKTTSQEGFIINHVIKIPNKNYPTEEELEKLENFRRDFKTSNMMKIPEDIANITRRKNNEKPYTLALIKSQIPESTYTKTLSGNVFLDFKDILQVNFKKYFYDLKKGQFVKTETSTNKSSYLYPEKDVFEIYADGNCSNPMELLAQGYLSEQKLEKLLPLDYQLGD